MHRKKCAAVFIFLTIFLGGVFFPLHAQAAETYPNKPITCIATTNPGGKDDMLMRAISPFAEKYLGSSLQILNVPGAGKKVGFTKLAKSKPDGYTIAECPLTAILCMEEYTDDIAFKTKDFSYIYAWVRSNQTLIVNAQRWKSFEDFLKYVRSNQVSAGVAHLGSGSHLAGLVVAKGLGIKNVTFVPFDGSSETVSALAGNHIDFATLNVVSIWPMVRAGQLKAMLILADEKDYFMPDVPIPQKYGLQIAALPALDGIVGPPKMPKEIVQTLEGAFAKAVKEPKFIEWAKNAQTELINLNAKEYKDLADKQAEVVKQYRDLLRAKGDGKAK